MGFRTRGVFKANDTKCNEKIKAIKVLKFNNTQELNNMMKEGLQLMNMKHEHISIVLADFGLAKQHQGGSELNSYAGTPLFMSPGWKILSKH